MISLVYFYIATQTIPYFSGKVRDNKKNFWSKMGYLLAFEFLIPIAHGVATLLFAYYFQFSTNTLLSFAIGFECFCSAVLFVYGGFLSHYMIGLSD